MASTVLIPTMVKVCLLLDIYGREFFLTCIASIIDKAIIYIAMGLLKVDASIMDVVWINDLIDTVILISYSLTNFTAVLGRAFAPTLIHY